MKAAPRILVIEDESVISKLLCTILAAQGYAVVEAANGIAGQTMAASHNPDLILLDLGLPDMDGIDLLEKLRAWYAKPVIVVSSRQYEGEKVQALDAGADDYVTKPFGNGELLARIRTALRRSDAVHSGIHAKQACFCVRDLRIDYGKRKASVAGVPVHLTPIEYRILVLLSRNAGRVLTHDYIIRQIWGPYAADTQTLRVNMANIRRRIEENPADPQYIRTEVGVGYRMIEEA